MRLYLVRHGIADNPSLDRPDFARALTEPGIERLRLQGQALLRAGFSVDLILTSPLVRAVQTAELLGKAFGIAPQEESLLGPGCRVPEVQEILGRFPDVRQVMIVGHQPDFGELVRELTGAVVKMRKGTLADVELYGPRALSGVLRGLYDPEVLAALGT